MSVVISIVRMLFSEASGLLCRIVQDEIQDLSFSLFYSVIL